MASGRPGGLADRAESMLLGWSIIWKRNEYRQLQLHRGASVEAQVAPSSFSPSDFGAETASLKRPRGRHIRPPRPQPEGGFARYYAWLDGRTEEALAKDENFAVWESENLKADVANVAGQ